MAGRFGGLSSRPQTCGRLQAPGRELGLTALPPLPRDPDSTYCDLPQPSQGDGDGVGGAEASMDVFQLQGLAAPSAMVSGAGPCGGRGVGRGGAASVDRAIPAARATGKRLPVRSCPRGTVRAVPSQNWKCVGLRALRAAPGVCTAASVPAPLSPGRRRSWAALLSWGGGQAPRHRPRGEDPSRPTLQQACVPLV